MEMRRSLAVGLTLLGVLGVSAVRAQREDGAKPDRRLDPDAVSVRLLLGVGDEKVQDWGGQVRVDKGDIVRVEGYRFRKGDRVTGRDSWEAQSRLIRKAAPKKAAAKQAAQGAV